MAPAYSDDLREKVLGAYGAGKGTLRSLAERCEVCYGWVKRIHAAEVGTGSRRRVAQRRQPNAIDGERVRRLLATKPHMVLRELQQAMLEGGQRVSVAQLGRVLKQLGLDHFTFRCSLQI